MPISYSVDKDLELFVLRFSGSVTTEQVRSAIAEVGQELGEDGSYRSLLIFDSSTDLSTIDKDALQRIQETSRDTLYRGRSRRSGAAMVNGSQDARLIMPLWNALCHSDPEIDLHFDIFTDLEPALSWLDIPPAHGRSIARGGEAVAD